MNERQDRATGPASGGGAGPSSGAALATDRSLSVLQRVLLTTDGTVVQLLEAWFDDPIELAGHQQFTTPVDRTDGELLPNADESILRRRVLLRGVRSRRNYIYADTAIVLGRLPPGLRDDLLTTSQPIGRLLQDHRMETRREVLRSGRRPAAALAGEFGIDSADELLYRVYRVVAAGLPIMLIAEHFPLAPLRAARGGEHLSVVDLRPDTEKRDGGVSDLPRAQAYGTP